MLKPIKKSDHISNSLGEAYMATGEEKLTIKKWQGFFPMVR
jgi:hypothetical protein